MASFTIVFDLDGTLVDTAPDLLGAVGLLLERKGLPALGSAVIDAEIKPLISQGSQVMLARALKILRHPLPADTFQAWWQEYLTIYADNIAVHSRPFDGLDALLDRLAARDMQFAVCTNKTEAMSRRLLEQLDMTSRFTAICGRDTFAFCKPDPRHLTETLRLGGGDVARAIMVGDSDVDIATAKAAGIPVIGVSFGYCHAPVATFNPDVVLDHYDDFDAALGKIAAGH